MLEDQLSLAGHDAHHGKQMEMSYTVLTLVKADMHASHALRPQGMPPAKLQACNPSPGGPRGRGRPAMMAIWGMCMPGRCGPPLGVLPPLAPRQGALGSRAACRNSNSMD
jgi:hypothetical protein